MVNSQYFNYCCGVREVEARYKYNGEELDTVPFGVSTFNQYQKNEYKSLQKYYKIVAQSEPMQNPYSGNSIFVVVFTKK